MYKILKNNLIIDITESLNYVRQNPRNKVIISCKKEVAQGIATQNGIYHLQGLGNFTQGYFDTVTAVEITEAEYEELKPFFTKEEITELE